MIRRLILRRGKPLGKAGLAIRFNEHPAREVRGICLTLPTRAILKPLQIAAVRPAHHIRTGVGRSE
jgi:hypothetical protein